MEYHWKFCYLADLPELRSTELARECTYCIRQDARRWPS